MISFMVAMDSNSLIGKDNGLPWHLPADLQYFKKVTTGHPVVMGRKTFTSLGKPLPGRENIIITRNEDYQAEGCTVAHSLEQVKDYAASFEGEVFIIGGAEIFKALMPIADRLYITRIHHAFEGDTHFPEINEENWQEISSVKGSVDEKNIYPHDFVVLERKK